MITEATKNNQEHTLHRRLKEAGLFDLAKRKLRGDELFQGQYWHQIEQR